MNDRVSQSPEPFPREKILPELIEWAKQAFDEEEFMCELREIEATGGVALDDFIDVIRAMAKPL